MTDALTALNSDVTVAYLDESRQKRIYYTGTAQKYTANALYSALMDHFDEVARMNNPSPISAQTPTEYTVGIIDVGDDEPWYITYQMMEHVTGGAVKTAGWTRDLPGDGTGAVGILIVAVSSGGSIDATDEGDTLAHASGDAGTLLEFIDTGGSTDYLVIRPSTNALADDFNTGSGTITMDTSANTATQSANGVTGEQVWANLYSIGTIESDTHIYLYQGAADDDATRTRVYSQYSATSDYWANGHIDVCVPLNDYAVADAPTIDVGYVMAYARKGMTEYANFEVSNSVTAGGRNPVPVGTKADLNNTTGTANLIWDNGSSDTLADGDKLYKVGTTTLGNLAAGVHYEDGSGYTDDTTDLNDVAGGGDVDVFPVAGESVNDAFYFGMETLFDHVVFDISTQGVSSGAATTWEYYNGSTWSALTVTDLTDSGNGAFTAGTGRFVLMIDSIPSDWVQTSVTNQPAALNEAYYIRVRCTAANYSVLPLLETAWAAGETQLKGLVRDNAITTPGGATGNTDYFLIGEPQSDFSDNDVILATSSHKTIDVNGAPTAQGPALSTWFTDGDGTAVPSIAYGSGQTSYTADIDNDSVDEYYGITIDCNNNELTKVYEWLKYITRNGETGTTNTDGIAGEQYIGGEVYLQYFGSVTGTFNEGDDVIQETSGATGVVVSHDATNKRILLRDHRGTFATGSATDHTVTTQDVAGSVEMETSAGAVAVTFAPNSVSPFGTFAGGTFFGARGVLLEDWNADDENSFQLTPLEGGTKSRPQAITLTVSNLVGTDESTVTDDRVSIFRLTGAGGQIDKTEYSAAGTEVAGDPTLAVDTPATIAVDTPAAGHVSVRDNSDNNRTYTIRYSSWTSATFTLANFAAFVTTATTNATQVTYATGGFTAAVKRGDLVYNSTVGAVSYVKSVDSDTQLTIEPPITGQANGDTVEINCVPIAMHTDDDIYVPFLLEYATGATASVNIVYDAQIYFRVVVRNSAATTKIKPFSTDDTTAGTDRSNSTVRQTDTIYS